MDDLIATFKNLANLLGINITILTDNQIQLLLNDSYISLILPLLGNNCQLEPNLLKTANIYSALYLLSKLRPDIMTVNLETQINSLSRTIPTGEAVTTSYSQKNQPKNQIAYTGIAYLDNLLNFINLQCNNGIFCDYEVPLFIEDEQGQFYIDIFQQYG